MLNKLIPIFIVLVSICINLPKAEAQGPPTFLQVGTLSCAARMYAPTQLQVWCFKDTALKVIVFNALSDILDTGLQIEVADSNNYDTNTSLVWLFLPTQLWTKWTVAWQAVITRATVFGPTLSGFLN